VWTRNDRRSALADADRRHQPRNVRGGGEHHRRRRRQGALAFGPHSYASVTAPRPPHRVVVLSTSAMKIYFVLRTLNWARPRRSLLKQQLPPPPRPSRIYDGCRAAHTAARI